MCGDGRLVWRLDVQKVLPWQKEIEEIPKNE
jgi:hypothetical protein